VQTEGMGEVCREDRARGGFKKTRKAGETVKKRKEGTVLTSHTARN